MSALPIPGREHAIIQEEIRKFFSDVLNVEVPSATTDLFGTGILDSQKFVELLLHLEEQFDRHIGVEDFEIDNFRCIEKIAILVLQSKELKG